MVPIAAIAFVLAWALLDLRWTANLGRQVVATQERYGGKETRGSPDNARQVGAPQS